LKFEVVSNGQPFLGINKPQTSNFKPQTPNPKPQTSNFKPQTSNFKPQTSNPNLPPLLVTPVLLPSFSTPVAAACVFGYVCANQLTHYEP
jgi:hypothetical protein